MFNPVNLLTQEDFLGRCFATGGASAGVEVAVGV